MRGCRNNVNAGLGMRAAVVPDCIMLLHERQPTSTSAKHDANLLFFFRRQIVRSDAGISKRFAGGGQRQWHGAWHVLPIFGSELGLPIKVLHLRGDLYRRVGNVKRFDSPHPTLAVLQRAPERFTTDADPRDASHAGDHHAPRMFELAQHSISTKGGSWVLKPNI